MTIQFTLTLAVEGTAADGRSTTRAITDHGKDSSGILTHRPRLAESVQHTAAAACGLCTKPL